MCLPPRSSQAGFTCQPSPCHLPHPFQVAVTDGSGAAVHLEVWDMPIENFGRFMLQVRPSQQGGGGGGGKRRPA